MPTLSQVYFIKNIWLESNGVPVVSILLNTYALMMTGDAKWKYGKSGMGMSKAWNSTQHTQNDLSTKYS